MRSEIETFKHEAVQTQSDRADQFAASYEAMLESPFEDCFIYSRYRLQEYLDRLIPTNGTGMKLLDVGCGTGHHMARLRKRGYEVVGIDISKEMLVYARENNPGSVILEADVEEIPLPNACFDLISSIEVLRHLPRSNKCIEEMARLLKPGGRCLVTATPFFNMNGYTLINFFANKVKIGKLARHRQAFHTSNRLRAEFFCAGLTVEEVIGVYTGPINWIGRLTPSVLPRVLKRWASIDRTVSNKRIAREFANMFLIHAVKA